jgi:hypothetical protein
VAIFMVRAVLPGKEGRSIIKFGRSVIKLGTGHTHTHTHTHTHIKNTFLLLHMRADTDLVHIVM